MSYLSRAVRCAAVCAAVCAIACAQAAFAAHPLATEDTGTQGSGNVEIENGLTWQEAEDARLFSYQPQVSYGLTPSLDLIVQPTWLAIRDAGSGVRTTGFGDTNLDAKWRFYGEAPWSLGVRTGATFATNRRGLGLPHGDVSGHLLAVATFDAAPFTIHANLGLTRNPRDGGERVWEGRVSTALMWAATEKWTLTAETSTASNTDPSRRAWQGTWLAGAIYTVRPGLDLDVGHQSAVNASLPRQWLLGITWRFAP